MAEKITSKIKGLFKSDDDKNAKLGRGEGTQKEMLEWIGLSSFTDLQVKGQEAFFKFLRGDKYGEDEDIAKVGVAAPGMCSDSRRYQFWLKCDQFDLDHLFNVYVKDEETRLPEEFRECYNKFKSEEDEVVNEDQFLKVKENDIKKTDRFLSDLKGGAKLPLDQNFLKFKEFIQKKYNEN